MLKAIKPFAGPFMLAALEVGMGIAGINAPLLGGIIIGIAIFWFALAVFSNKALIRRIPGILEWMPFLDPTGGFAPASQLTGRLIHGQTFNVMAVQNDGTIRGRHFEDCDIYGPAVICIGKYTSIRDCTFDHASCFILVTQDAITGPIVTEDCTYKRCRFHRIGFIGQKQIIDLLSSGTINAESEKK